MTIEPQKIQEFAKLFSEFAANYPSTPQGQQHIQRYPECRQQGEANFKAAVASADRSEDVTEFVLLKLLPYENTAPNRAKGAWIHIAPSVTKDIKMWFEGAGWARAEDWPKIAQAILAFVRRCAGDPGQLSAACAEFAALPFVKGLQTGMLTPILNALCPDDFLLVNTKSRGTINYFTGIGSSLGLRDYPKTNGAGKELIGAVAEVMKSASGLNMRPCDLFDMFSHWLVGIKGPPWEVGFWKISPGDDAWEWPECREKGYIAVGWDELGDLSGVSRGEFDKRRDKLIEADPEYTKQGCEQLWKFSRIDEGDRIVANRGTGAVLGIGTVTGPYYFVPGIRHGHRLPVRWDDVAPREVDKGGWRRTLIELDRQEFEDICKAGPLKDGGEGGGGGAELHEGGGSGTPFFTAKTFELLAGLHETPTKEYYAAHKAEFKAYLDEPFDCLLERVRERVRPEIRERMETEDRLCSRILKNDYGKGGAWDFYWGAFYPKGGERTKDVQLWVMVNGNRMEAGFSFGDYSQEKRKTFLDNLAKHCEVLASWLDARFGALGVFYGSREEFEARVGREPRAAGFAAWAAQIGELEPSLRVAWPRDRVLEMGATGLSERVTDLFNALFPLVLLAIDSDPLPAIRAYLEGGSGGSSAPPLPPQVQPEYPLAACAAETGFDVATLETWVRAINRKGQAIIYGPPGTGKTLMAEKLATHLIGGGNGFSELVQFHPAYAYEDFMQGLRPQTKGGALHYELVPGRFLDFCKRAAARTGPCVLIVDEINRANLARVFGELMYLLEYRQDKDEQKRAIPLAGGGTLRIPGHVRIIGTMNTADRSIAHVDHALRRRFASIPLYPRYEILGEFHAKNNTGFATNGLVEQLKMVNDAIGDRHYHVGVSFFLRTDLAAQLCDIWQMEIEPYLEDYFFDQPEKFKQFRWDHVKSTLVP